MIRSLAVLDGLWLQGFLSMTAEDSHRVKMKSVPVSKLQSFVAYWHHGLHGNTCEVSCEGSIR